MIKTLWFCAFPGKFSGGCSTDDQWASMWFVKALKGESVNSECQVLHPETGQKFTLNNSTQGNAPIWAAKFIADRLQFASGKGLLFVPVPCHDCTSAGHVQRCRVFMLGQMIIAKQPKWRIEPLLWLSNPVEKARKNGPRKAHQLYPNLQMGSSAHPDLPIILLDDVVTLGGHIQACKAKLVQGGRKVLTAFCVAKTVHSTWPKPVFKWDSEEFEDYQPPSVQTTKPAAVPALAKKSGNSKT